MRALWLLTLVLLTWQTVDPRYTVEVQRQTGRGEWRTQLVLTGDRYEDEVSKGTHRWRVRYVLPGAPQESAWSNVVRIRVR